MANSQSDSGPLPNRWLYCPRKSDTIILERFLAFKTPLSKDFEDKMPIECAFSPQMLFDYCKLIKLKLGLWIDLTNTNRFYNRATVVDQGAQFIKLQCRGHGETPSPQHTHSFIEIVDQFINEHPFDVIAVHCTHGFNRTGFLIVSYMVERLDCSLEAALSIFANARPPGIYKQDYINELFRRYNDGEHASHAPEKPFWCMEYDDSDCNDNARKSRKRHYDNSMSQIFKQATGASCFNNNDDDNKNDKSSTQSVGGSPGKKQQHREIVVKNAMFMAGVPGVKQVSDQPRLWNLQIKVQEWCGWYKNGFPGAQPVSMDLNNMKRLSQIPYRVSWKADGTRYMMLILKRDELYFFDRNLSCFEVENISFVRAENLNEHLEDTLVDGEMVLDKVGAKVTPRFLVYDIVRLTNKDVSTKPFYPDRLACIKQKVIDPRYQAMTKGIINRALEPFSVRNKDFWEISSSTKLLSEKFSRSLAHEPDGLIFQPSLQPYTSGQCTDVLKWKPHELNSVDFLLKISVESGAGLLATKIGFLYVGGCDAPFGRLQKLNRELREMDNKIIECTLNKYGNWEFLRERIDKKFPNSYNTAKSVTESIKKPVTKEILLDFIAHIHCRDN